MQDMQRKERRRLLFEILYVSMILVSLTWFWYGPRQEMQKKNVDTGYVVEGLTTLEVNKEIKEQTIAITNKDAKGNILLRFEEEGYENRFNEIYYQIITEEQVTEVRNLSQDGALYLLGLQEKGNTSLQVRMWTEEETPILGTFKVESALSNV